MRRIVALDIGSVRIGVAVSDPLGMFAQGAAVLNARGDWLAELADIVAQYGGPVILGCRAAPMEAKGRRRSVCARRPRR